MICKKNTYRTKAIAKKYKKRAQKMVWKKLYIYKCDKCYGFHYTSLWIWAKIYFRSLKKRYEKI